MYFGELSSLSACLGSLDGVRAREDRFDDDFVFACVSVCGLGASDGGGSEGVERGWGCFDVGCCCLDELPPPRNELNLDVVEGGE